VGSIEQTHPELANALGAIRLEGKADLGVTAHWVWVGAAP
jgi:hypothetical protein